MQQMGLARNSTQGPSRDKLQLAYSPISLHNTQEEVICTVPSFAASLGGGEGSVSRSTLTVACLHLVCTTACTCLSRSSSSQSRAFSAASDRRTRRLKRTDLPLPLVEMLTGPIDCTGCMMVFKGIYTISMKHCTLGEPKTVCLSRHKVHDWDRAPFGDQLCGIRQIVRMKPQ